MSLYDILEIKPNASEHEIKKAYHNLSKKYHPDKCKDEDATIKFQEINTAYNILMNEQMRKEYIQMNVEEKSKIQLVLEKLFNGSLNIDLLKSLGLNISTTDWKYLEINYLDLIKSINFRELFELITKGQIPEKRNVNVCTDTENDCWDEKQAEYYYDLPLYNQKQNLLNINIHLNVTLNDIMENHKKKIKIKRQFEDEFITTTYIFELKSPYIVFNSGGDMNDGDFGDLIIHLKLDNDNKFYWKENMIYYEYPITLYQMIYGLNINLELSKDVKINYENYVPSRDGLFISLENVKIKNYIFGIKLVLNYEHSEEKEEILKLFFNI